MLRDALLRLLRVADEANQGSGLSGLESHRRVLLLSTMSLIGVVFLLCLGINCYWQGFDWLGTFLLAIAAVACLNLLWLRRDQNFQLAVRVFSLCTILLSAVLLISGGIANTGLLWIYPLIAMAIFVSGLLVGLVFVALFMLFATMALLLPESPILLAQYPPEVATRFLISLLALCAMCLTSELTRFKSQREVGRLHQEICDAANTDSLTKLHNRRFVQQQMIQHDRFREEVTSGGAVLLADIDHFKRINDRFGHDVGDEILQKVAACLLQCTRAGDIVARWGGEEFLIILPDIAYDVAVKRAEHFRKAIAALEFRSGADSFNVTMSFGLGVIQPHASASEILKRSDENLYAAKAAGRNCVVPCLALCGSGL